MDRLCQVACSNKDRQTLVARATDALLHPTSCSLSLSAEPTPHGTRRGRTKQRVAKAHQVRHWLWECLKLKPGAEFAAQTIVGDGLDATTYCGFHHSLGRFRAPDNLSPSGGLPKSPLKLLEGNEVGWVLLLDLTQIPLRLRISYDLNRVHISL